MAPQVRVVAKNLMLLVASLPVVKLDLLYANPFICEAILSSMEEWVLPDGLSKHRVDIDRLIQLRLFTQVVDGRKKDTSYEMNRISRINLQKKLIYGGVLPRCPLSIILHIRCGNQISIGAEMLSTQLYDEFLSKDVFEGGCDHYACVNGGLLFEDTREYLSLQK